MTEDGGRDGVARTQTPWVPMVAAARLKPGGGQASTFFITSTTLTAAGEQSPHCQEVGGRGGRVSLITGCDENRDPPPLSTEIWG